MGADIYIDKIMDAAAKKYKPLFKAAVEDRDAVITPKLQEAFQKEVATYYDLMYPENGYFRDSYNSTSLFTQLNLSWWKDVGGMLSKKGSLLNAPKIKRLRKIVADRKIPALDKMKLEHVTIDDGENSRENWHKMFVKKKAAFLKFLDGAIKMKTSIRCSL